MHMKEKEAFDTLRFILYAFNVRRQYKPDMRELQVNSYTIVVSFVNRANDYDFSEPVKTHGRFVRINTAHSFENALRIFGCKFELVTVSQTASQIESRMQKCEENIRKNNVDDLESTLTSLAEYVMLVIWCEAMQRNAISWIRGHRHVSYNGAICGCCPSVHQ